MIEGTDDGVHRSGWDYLPGGGVDRELGDLCVGVGYLFKANDDIHIKCPLTTSFVSESKKD